MKKSEISLVVQEEQNNHLSKITKTRRPPSLKECISATIIANYSEKSVHSIIDVVFIELEKTVRWFNLNDFKKPDSEVMLFWAETLVDQYRLEAPEDFLRFFDLIRKGSIGLNFYERLGYDIIQKAFAKYLHDLKLPEKERKINNDKIEKQKDVDRLHVVNGWSEVLKTISLNKKKRIKSNSNESSYSKRDELNDLKKYLDSYPISTLKNLQSQYELIARVENKKVKRDKGGKIIESRLSLLSLRKQLNG